MEQPYRSTRMVEMGFVVFMSGVTSVKKKYSSVNT